MATPETPDFDKVVDMMEVDMATALAGILHLSMAEPDAVTNELQAISQRVKDLKARTASGEEIDSREYVRAMAAFAGASQYLISTSRMLTDAGMASKESFMDFIDKLRRERAAENN